MKITFLRATIVAAAALLAGCAAQPEIPFDSSANTIHAIGVTVDMPPAPSVILASDIGQSFGLVGALIDAGMAENRDKKLRAIMAEGGVDSRAVFTQAISESLVAHGYQAVPIVSDRAKHGFLKSYPPAADSKVDAYLDITLVGDGYGYVASGIGDTQPFRPFVWANCRLIKASDGSVLMQDMVLYNWVAINGMKVKAVEVSPDPAYSYPNMDDLVAHGPVVREGLDKALRQTADAIINLIR